MSTRSVIARVGKNEGEFAGRYVHWDGSPTTRGPLLWKIIHEDFKGDLRAALVYLIDQHPSGWSSLENRNCYCHPRRSKQPEFERRKPEPAQLITHEHVETKDSDIEYCFIFDEEHNRMFVGDVANDSDHLVELAEGKQPDWGVIECGENYDRCHHYAWFHQLTPRSSNLSTQTWLGNRPLTFHDAIAFIINGKQWASTGCGGNSDYYNRSTRGRWPGNAWIASVKSKNGRRMDFPVAVINGQEYLPAPNVAWIYPPTKNNPTETTMGA